MRVWAMTYDMPSEEETLNRLRTVSSSFCLAKWTQVTAHLDQGLTHSCHHPTAHSIPMHELAKNGSALHNTQEKIRERKQMMEGVRPKGCQYCWNIEDKTNQVSDRVLKSREDWSMPHLQEVISKPLDVNFLPRYFEVSFSRACNFKCSYCSPTFSTSWAQDVLRGGGFPGREFTSYSVAKLGDTSEEENPYIKAFWEWWPQLRPALHTFRITGGEPLLSANTFKVIEMLRLDPSPQLEFSINSNLGVPQTKVTQLVEGVRDLVDHGKVKNFLLFSSIEAWGKRAEYIRFGLDTDLFWSNLELILSELPSVSITLMMTFNAMSVTSFRPLMVKLLELRKKYHNASRPIPVLMDICYLRHPSFLAVNILPEIYREEVRGLVDFMQVNSIEQLNVPWGFNASEIGRLERTYQWMNTKPEQEILLREKLTFFNFVAEHDKRRGTDFLKTFPEMAGFWEECRSLALGHDFSLLL